MSPATQIAGIMNTAAFAMRADNRSPVALRKLAQAMSGPVRAPREKQRALATAHPKGIPTDGERKMESSPSSMKATDSMADHWTDQARVSQLAGARPKTICARKTAVHERPQVRMTRASSATFRPWVSQTIAIMAAYEPPNPRAAPPQRTLNRGTKFSAKAVHTHLQNPSRSIWSMRSNSSPNQKSCLKSA